MANRLIDEQSPYLLQHAHNPVDWHPWGDAAFEEAKSLGKPLIVSIGYAACHWCHVMERESFEDRATADFMNEHFVCIKVDREEHPDVDALYMDAVQALTGSVGWPLNVFVTPDRIPFYGGTYYPPRPAYNRPSWMQVLQRMSSVWDEQPGEVKAQSEQMVNYLRQTSEAPGGGVSGSRADQSANTPEQIEQLCRDSADGLLKMADKDCGGFGGAPKFPGTMAITFLMEHHHFYGNEAALKHALLSLDKMIGGGIYDQLGGGFARYSTDKEWLAPHFEKMLYDNALLVHTLCDAYAITGDSRYQKVIDDTIAFVNRELQDETGAFYCALDADSEGVEGRFYTWTWGEWNDALGGNDAIAAMYLGIEEEGNWEGTNILHVAADIDAVAKHFHLGTDEVQRRIEEVKKKLLAKRKGRIRPGTDDKCLLSWNALMNLGLTRAGVVLQQENYLEQALAHTKWMLSAFKNEEGLLHTWKGGKARITAKLDDYAYLIQALLQAGSITGDHSLILLAAEQADYVTRHFSKDDGALFYFTSDTQKDIPIRKVDVYDGAAPSANAVMMHNLYLLGLIMERTDWLERAERGILSMAATTGRYTYSFSYWAMLLQRMQAGIKTAVVSGKNSKKYARELVVSYQPILFTLFSLTEKKGIPLLIGKSGELETLIFVCTSRACQPPVTSVTAAIELIEKH